jgi:hypothetical protein
VIQRRAYGLRDEEYLKLKILTTGLPELWKCPKTTNQNPRRPIFWGTRTNSNPLWIGQRVSFNDRTPRAPPPIRRLFARSFSSLVLRASKGFVDSSARVGGSDDQKENLSPNRLLCNQRAHGCEKLCFADGFLQDGRGLHQWQFRHPRAGDHNNGDALII